MELGIFPDRLKLAIVKPVHEKVDAINIKNYRPISLLSVFSKIFEKAMSTRLTAFVAKNNILTEAQNRFREAKSTETAIHDFFESIHKRLQMKKLNSLIGIFFDLSKAYNVLNHKTLLSNMELEM